MVKTFKILLYIFYNKKEIDLNVLMWKNAQDIVFSKKSKL